MIHIYDTKWSRETSQMRNLSTVFCHRLPLHQIFMWVSLFFGNFVIMYYTILFSSVRKKGWKKYFIEVFPSLFLCWYQQWENHKKIWYNAVNTCYYNVQIDTYYLLLITINDRAFRKLFFCNIWFIIAQICRSWLIFSSTTWKLNFCVP